MPVQEGTNDREFTPLVNHVTNGDPGNQNTFRAPTVDLEKRTDALLDFVNSLEAFVQNLLGTDASSVSGVQGNFNANHNHDGTNGSLIDFQQIYNNGNDDAVINVATNGSLTINLNTGADVFIRTGGGDPLIRVDNDTEKVYIGKLQQQFD